MTNKQTKLLFTLIDFIDFTTTSRKWPLCCAPRVVAYDRVKYNLLWLRVLSGIQLMPHIRSPYQHNAVRVIRYLRIQRRF